MYNYAEKLVAQTYHGASVITSELTGIEAKIKERVPEITYTHCYAHKFNLFFNKSTKRTHLLDEVVKRCILRATLARWNSASRLVQTINLYQSNLCALFWIMRKIQMTGMASTCFLFMAYYGIFYETDALFRVLQNKQSEQKRNELGLAESETLNKQPIRVERERIYYNLLDNINVQMRDRFDHFGELHFLG
ncbi:unnamed protein product [Coregonus sp. 'balchen']|nr:unnamed protein product [Coregonus sp. 'balchen']